VDLLTITTDPTAPYQATIIVEPAVVGWLHLPSLHAKLLPLALAAGHERLLLAAHIEGPESFYYEADATGGASGFRRYIGFFDHGSAPVDFERVLTAKLTEQQASRAHLST
jgi:hypothetical protein